MVSLEIAHKYADKECTICEGEGALVSNEEGDEEYCLCVQERKAEEKGESLSDEERGN